MTPARERFLRFTRKAPVLTEADCREAQAIFERSPVEAAIDAHNDISVLAALWNAGPTNRQRALALADEDCRRAQAPKENTR